MNLFNSRTTCIQWLMLLHITYPGNFLTGMSFLFVPYLHEVRCKEWRDLMYEITYTLYLCIKQKIVTTICSTYVYSPDFLSFKEI